MGESAANNFRKSERVVSRKLMESLFARGSRSVMAFPLRAVCLQVERTEGSEPVQVLVSVSKRHFKRAVHRNRAKRQIREAYRLNKEVLRSVVAGGTSLAVALIWLADEPMESHRVTKSMKTILHRLAERQVGKKTERQVDKKTERP